MCVLMARVVFRTVFYIYTDVCVCVRIQRFLCLILRQGFILQSLQELALNFSAVFLPQPPEHRDYRH